MQITRQRQEITDALTRLHLTAWSLWSFAVVAAIVITLQLYRRLIGTRVAMLLRSIDAFARGERELKLAIRAPREFADIGNSLNSMARATREAEKALEKKQDEERALQRRLDQSERAAEIGRVAEGLAHELGAPLTVIDGRVRQMERRPDAPGTRIAMQEVRQQVQRMGNIVRQLLSYARRENAGHDAIELANLVGRVCQGSAADAPQPELSCTSHTLTHGDRVRVEMAVANIVRNAQRHALSSVWVTVERRGGNAIVRVEDDGPGVSAEDEREIFKPFFSREPTGSGSGLGLAIVNNIMQEHGGSVDYSLGSHGAIFELVFPATDNEDSR